jgi:UDP-2-acetamido-3-amino-2,3-dideoxy-glucuronate N-acetyltransferase
MSCYDYYAHPTAVIDEPVEIGLGSRIWHFCHVMSGARIGSGCSLGQNCFVAGSVVMGSNCKVQNNVSIYDGVVLGDDVFLGPSCVFTNVSTPRSAVDRRGAYEKTIVEDGVTVGANATIVCGVRLGTNAFVGAGSVVTRDVPPHGLVLGVPGRLVGWACGCGVRLETGAGAATCPSCGQTYRLDPEGRVVPRRDETGGA